MSQKRKIICTSALPYANGPIHIGHLVEYTQTDIWVRFQKARGHQCHYFCADDTHGTPIMLSAKAQGIPPEDLISRVREEHYKDFTDFLIEFDNYYTTHSPENKALSEKIYQALVDNGYIETRTVELPYCDHDQMFLPDRLIRGTCPICSAPDQYGDSCEICSSTYSSRDLKNARCALCSSEPSRKSTQHKFFMLSRLQTWAREWLESGTVHPSVRAKNLEWFSKDLKDWDITRDAPYFGFQIPGETDKYFYVWLDAPIGYLASIQNWATANNVPFESLWQSKEWEVVHFIGKDISYFHTIFWPTVLKASGLRTPDQVFVHGFLKVDGAKMSKSRGTFISARTFLQHLPPETLRYYFASKLGPGPDDIDLVPEELVARVNDELADKFANLGSRAITLLNKNFDSRLGSLQAAGLQLVQDFESEAQDVAAAYDGRDYARAIRQIAALCKRANQFMQEMKPWEVLKSDPEQARNILTAAINAFAKVAVMLAPVVPGIAAKAGDIVGIDTKVFDSVSIRLENTSINKYLPVFMKIQAESLAAMIEASKPVVPAPAFDYEVPELAQPQINIDTFLQTDLRIAQVLTAEAIDGSDKLLRLKITLGPLGERTILAGIKKYYKPEDIIDRLIVVVANLEHRKMKFGTSEGMVLAASDKNDHVLLLSADTGAKPGMRVG